VLKETKRWKSRWTVRDLLADRRCGRAVLDFLSAADVGRLVPPLEEKGDAGSEVSEWELRECRERQEEREGDAEALGAVDDKGDGEEGGGGGCRSKRGNETGKIATSRHCADRGQESWAKCTPPLSI